VVLRLGTRDGSLSKQASRVLLKLIMTRGTDRSRLLGDLEFGLRALRRVPQISALHNASYMGLEG